MQYSRRFNRLRRSDPKGGGWGYPVEGAVSGRSVIVKVSIAGRGRVGRGLAHALEGGDLEWDLGAGRECAEAAFADADLVVLAVPTPPSRPARRASRPG